MTHVKLNYLETIDAFQDLSLDEVRAVNDQTRLVHYPSGHLFYMPDDPGEVLFILKEGRVQLYRTSIDGRKLVVAELRPGAIFGQMMLVGQRMHKTFAQALDDCVICVWDRAHVERLLVEKPQFALRLLEAVGQRLIQAEEGLVEATFKRMPSRLAGLLLRMQQANNGSSFIKGYTHQYFADMLGTYRETATQILNDFRQKGFIQIRRKSIRILDKEGLRKTFESD